VRSSFESSKRWSHDIEEDDNLMGELIARRLPVKPMPELQVEEAAAAVIRGLQYMHTPYTMAGMERAYNFMTFACRKAVTGRQGATSFERFQKYAELSPQLLPIIGCDGIQWLDAPTIIPSTQTRGAIASIPLLVYKRRGFRFQSGFERIPVTDNDNDYDIDRFVIRLQKERRPPLTDCWLVDQILDVRYAFAGDMGNDAVAN